MAGAVIGIVKSAQGVVDVRSANGQIRSLLVGDSLREGDTVLTTGGGRLVIALNEGGELVMGPGEVVVMTAELSADRHPGADESQVASVDSILAALNEGRDLSTLLEPTAAGPAGGPGTNEGHTFVQLLRIVEPVGAVNSATTAGLQNQAPEIEPIYPIDFNSNPDAVDDSGETQEGVPVTITVLTNDTDPENDPLTVTNVQLLNNAPGTVTLNPDQTVTYNPGSAFNNLGQGETATVQISYTISDGNGGSDTAIITVTINGLNDPPTVVVDTGNPGGANDVSNESGLPAGSGNDPTNIEAGGSFQVADPDGVDEIVSVTINYTDAGGQPASVTIPIGVLGTSDPLNVIQTNAGQLTITGYNSTTGVATYEYVLTTATTDVPDVTETDVFTVTTTDGVATSAPATITIEIIDDVPVAQNDADSVTEDAPGPAVGNVVTGAGGDNDDGADTVGADGVQSVTWANSQNGGTVVIGQHGVLTVGADGSYSYALNNEDPAVQALDEGDSLIETFSYTLTDGDGDSSTAVLTVTINGAEDSASVVTAAAGSAPDATVYESGLNPDGSDAGATTETVTGSFTVSATDGIANVVIGGTVFTLAEVQAFNGTQTVNTGQGVLTLTSYVGSASSGTINYSYTLSATIDNDSVVPTGNDAVTAAHFDDSVVLTVNGAGGTTGSDNLVIRAIDDVPTAVDDGPASITEDGAPSVGGNVLTNDTAGADGVQSVTWANVQDGGTVVVGAHGVLYVSADGGYTYELNNADLEVQALNQGETLTETFTYTLTDGDNDSDTAVLTVTINGSNDSASVVTAAATGPDGTVYESGLNPNGSNAGATTETTTGTFTVSASDGISTVVIGGTVFTLAQVVAFDGSQTVNTGQGVLTLTGYSGTANSGTISYSYTLSATIDNDGITPTGDDAVTAAHFDDSVELTVNGASGSTGSDDLVIRAIDDVPDAANDVDSIASGSFGPATGNVITDAEGDGGADVRGADGGNVTAVTGAGAAVNGVFTATGQYGVLTLNTDGSYSYTRNAGTPGGVSDTFTYTLTDGDGDADTATLTISIGNSTPTISGLTPQGSGGDVIVDEDDLSDGSDTTKESLTQAGSFTITSPDGVANLSVGGTAFITNGVFTPGSVVTPLGNTLSITGYNAGTGVVSYTYTLGDNEAHASGNGQNALFENFNVVLTDPDGQVANDVLSVQIVDDVPTAVADGPVGVVEDGVSNISGDVLTNDTSGADAPTSFVSWGADAAAIASLNTYGTLVQNANGTWSYVLDNSRPATQALTSASNLSFTLNYTMKDADGDTSSSTLTITITGANDGVTVTGIGNAAGDETVYENDLPNGSSPNNAALTQTGTFSITALDGISSVQVGGTSISLAQLTASGTTPITIDTPYGALTINGYSGNAQGGTVSYSYKLDTKVDNDSQAGATGTGFVETLAVTVTDSDGSTGNSSLNIAIVDDAPYFTHVNDSNDGIVSLSALNPATDTTYNGQFADWRFGADGFGEVSASGTNVQVASSSSSQIVLNLMSGTDVVATLTLNADGTDSLEVLHRDGQVVFTPIAATSATPGGPAGSLLVDLAAATEFNILVTGDDGVAPVGSATDTVNTSTQGWAVKGGSGQSNDPGESILFSFVDDGNNTTGYGVGDFKFRTQGFTGGMNSAQISVIVYLSADMTSFDVVTLNATDNQLIQISQLDWSANAGTGSYEPGDEIYGVKVVASATNTGGFRINGVEVGAESTTPPPDLDFNNVTVSVTDADGDVATQTFNIHIDGDTGNALTVEAIAGTSANDVLVGTAANDVLIGGSGHDTLTGAGGSDTFVWRLADKGAAGAPAVDTVTDFGTGGTDKLDLRDLLQGENKADLSNLDNYLHFTQAGGTTTVHISSSGGFAGGFNAGAVDQQITLTNVDLTNAGSLGSDQAIINNLLTNGKLVTD